MLAPRQKDPPPPPVSSSSTLLFMSRFLDVMAQEKVVYALLHRPSNTTDSESNLPVKVQHLRSLQI